jgi:hypothetical protein
MNGSEEGRAVAEAIKDTRIYCNHCKSKTRHSFVGSRDYYFGGDEEGPDEWGTYRLWACAGCDTCVMEDYCSADYMGDGDGNNVFSSIYHPKRAHLVRPTKFFMKVPPKLGKLYREVISSYNENLPLLCAAGLRSLVEGISADKRILGDNLEKRIEGMKSLLPESVVKNLHGFRFIGNRAVHELEAPEKNELTLAIDVIEDILNFLYALDYKASLLGKLKASQGESFAAAATAASEIREIHRESILSPAKEERPKSKPPEQS